MSRDQDLPERFRRLLAGKPSFLMRSIEAWPPRIWASIYILMIPLAGFIFWALPSRSFYDSNLIREAGFYSDRATVASLLASAIRQQEYGDDTGGQLPVPTWYARGMPFIFSRDTVDVPSASIDVGASGNIALTIQGGTDAVKIPSMAGLGGFADMVTLLGTPSAYVSPENGALLIGYTVSFTTTPISYDGQPPLNIVLPGAAGDTAKNPNTSIIWVSSRTSLAVENLSAAGEGDAKEASGLLLRMCYLSAVTITTLGFGDITPVSTTARVLVGIEAILGVVLIGLFLNAIARKSRKGA